MCCLNSCQVFIPAAFSLRAGPYAADVSLKVWLRSPNRCHFTTTAQSLLLFLAPELFHWSTPENSWLPSEDICSPLLCNSVWMLDGFKSLFKNQRHTKMKSSACFCFHSENSSTCNWELSSRVSNFKGQHIVVDRYIPFIPTISDGNFH